MISVVSCSLQGQVAADFGNPATRQPGPRLSSCERGAEGRQRELRPSGAENTIRTGFVTASGSALFGETEITWSVVTDPAPRPTPRPQGARSARAAAPQAPLTRLPGSRSCAAGRRPAAGAAAHPGGPRCRPCLLSSRAADNLPLAHEAMAKSANQLGASETVAR